MTVLPLRNTTADWQAADSAHHLHPFTDHADLHRIGPRIITRAEGSHLFDSEGRKLLDRYGIATPLSAYHEHNAAQARPRLLARLGGGAAIALVSDAGTPLVSDPGYKLVREARAAGASVTAVPGPSAVLAALTLSGLPSDAAMSLAGTSNAAAWRRYGS